MKHVHSKASIGTLYLVPTPLDFGCEAQGEFAPLNDQLPDHTIRLASRTLYWLTENAKSTRAFLKRVDAVCLLTQPLQSLIITELPREVHKKGDHATATARQNNQSNWQTDFLAHAKAGHDVALICEAGMPAIADPGSSVVRAAHKMGIPVHPLSGPVSLMLALAASGLNGQNFAFRGYCPQDKEARKTQILQAQQLVHQSSQTQIWIETPYRNKAFLDALLHTLAPQIHLAVCAALTLPSPLIRSSSVQAWRDNPWDAKTQLSKLPCVFLIGM